MHKEVKGFLSTDGKFFLTEKEAVVQELKIVLLQIIGGNEGIVNVLLAQRDILFPLIKELALLELAEVGNVKA